MRFTLADLDPISARPTSGEGEWLAGAEDSIAFLQRSMDREEIILYASANAVFIHGVLVLRASLRPLDAEALLHADFPMLDDAWAIQRTWGGGQEHRIYLEPPLDAFNGKALEGGEKLVFRRPFDGVDKGETPIELSQKLVHCLDLHFLRERSAYSRLNHQGDIEDVIRVIQKPGLTADRGVEVVTILRRELHTYLALSDTCLAVKFDFTRVKHEDFGGWGELERHERLTEPLVYSAGKNGRGSFANGVLIVRPNITVSDLVQEWKNSMAPSGRKFATFKIFDRKNDRNTETSCAPGFLSNYFQDSTLPWEISPAFFHPEVLHRFKADPEKFRLTHRSISCRNAWHLQTYDINEAGQVHTYIGYLARLPYEEQLYWQSFNAWPIGTISERARKTDIEGDWDRSYDPLSALKERIRALDDKAPWFWKPRGETLSDATRCPATDSPKEWGDEVLALDQLLVEGFIADALRNFASKNSREVDPKWGSLRLLQEVLAVQGLEADEAIALMAPLRALHALRTVVKGHSMPQRKHQAEQEARTAYGTFRKHFTRLVGDCERSLDQISSLLAQ